VKLTWSGSSKDFTGAAIVHLQLNRLNDLQNHTFSLVELDFSSDDIITTFSELHNGDDPEIIEYTENDYRRDLKDGLMGAMRAGRMKGLAVGCDWTGEKVQGFTGWQEKTLEEYGREFIWLLVIFRRWMPSNGSKHGHNLHFQGD